MPSALLDTRTQHAKVAGRTRRSPTLGSMPTSRPRILLGCFFLIVIALATYSRSLRNGFVDYDDKEYVTANEHVQSGLHWETVQWAITTQAAGNWHPLTWLSHAMDVQIYGLNPAGHHFTSILLHTVNTLLLFLLLFHATRATGRSLLVAALFALHPLNVECVAWVAERKSVLSALLFFLALAAYGWYARRPSIQRYLVVAIAFALGLAAKPMLVTLPFVLLLLDFWPLQRVEGQALKLAGLYTLHPISRLVLEKLPLLGLSAMSAVVTVIAQRSANAMVPFTVVPLSWRIENAIRSYAMYLLSGFWPTDLAPFYPGTPLTFWNVFLPLMSLLVISLWTIRERTRRPYLIIGWLWFLGMLVPVIGVIQVGGQAMADRYAYLPLIGVLVMAIWASADLADSWRVPLRVRYAVTGAMLVVMATLVWRQIGFWRSPFDLWTHTLQVTRDNLIAEDNLGVALMDAGQDDEAADHFRNAIRIKYAAAEAHLNLGALLQRHGRLDEAIGEYEAVVGTSGDAQDLIMAYHNLGTALRDKGDFALARENYQKVLRIDPTNANAMVALGKVELLAGAQRLSQQLSQRPSGDGYAQLGQVWEEAGRLAEARAAYEKALRMNPKLDIARKSLDAITPALTHGSN